MSFAKTFINDRIDFEVDLANGEINRIELQDVNLVARIEFLNIANLKANQVALILEDLISRYGDFLGQEFRDRIQLEIDSEKKLIADNTVEIAFSEQRLIDNEVDLPQLKQFVKCLLKLKKKDPETEVFSVLIGNINEGENMEISLEKDGNAKVASIANKDGMPLARKVQWALEGDDIGSLTPSEDGMSANIKGNGKAGAAQLVARVGKLSDDDAELFESNRIDVKGLEKPDTAVAQFTIEEF